MNPYAQIVKGCPLFAELYDEEVEEVIEACMVETHNKGDIITKQGSESSNLGIVLYGQCKIILEDEDTGETKELGTLNKNDIFGEMVLINELKRSASIVASSAEVNVLNISRDDFYRFYQENPKIFGLMTINITRLVIKRLKNADVELKKALHHPHS